MSADPFPPDDKFEEGIYFDLPEDRYHALPWIGSSDMKMLATRPEDYWHTSAMNPNPPPQPDKTSAKMIGTAVHTRVLHGLAAFEKQYDAVMSENGESVTAKGYEVYIKSKGAKPVGLKADYMQFVRDEYGKELLSAPTYQRIVDSVDHIMQNDAIRQSFQGGWPEVSIFWRTEGVPMKCRIDYLKLAASIDLKSIRAHDRMMAFDKMCLREIWNRLYDCQAAHYTEGRVAAKALLRAGKVFAAGDRPDDAWLEKALWQHPEPGWVFIFYKMDAAPMAIAIQSTFGGPVIERGRHWTRVGITNFQAYFARFGRSRWVSKELPYTVSQEDEPKW